MRTCAVQKRSADGTSQCFSLLGKQEGKQWFKGKQGTPFDGLDLCAFNGCKTAGGHISHVKVKQQPTVQPAPTLQTVPAITPAMPMTSPFEPAMQLPMQLLQPMSAMPQLPAMLPQSTPPPRAPLGGAPAGFALRWVTRSEEQLFNSYAECEGVVSDEQLAGMLASYIERLLVHLVQQRAGLRRRWQAHHCVSCNSGLAYLLPPPPLPLRRSQMCQPWQPPSHHRPLLRQPLPHQPSSHHLPLLHPPLPHTPSPNPPRTVRQATPRMLHFRPTCTRLRGCLV